MVAGTLKCFIIESNRIEGIDGCSPNDALAHEELLGLRALTVPDIERFVSLVQPGAILRRSTGLNVRVGGYIAPPGGPAVEAALGELLAGLGGKGEAYATHVEYERLHPFTDGNGRSGRAIWLWMRRGWAGDGFLSQWNAKYRWRYGGDFYKMRSAYYASLRE